MADHIWTVLCTKAVTDRDTNVISLFEVAEKITLSGQANADLLLEQAKEAGNKGIQVDARIQLVTWWIRSDVSLPEVALVRLAYVNPEGERLFEQSFEVNLEEGGAVSRRTIIRFDSLRITGFGRYWFVVEQQKQSKGTRPRWVVAARLPMEIEQEQPESEVSASI